ncbi:hypothetical protein C7I85_29540 [Mesorhizobium soli]|uniref:Uncharacterized protein n=1 Tax=Pseudaminobacter soli (ex Li et al. 2025) TaxID=1295366 RepID=A0A2P7RMC7_9HYPH|nr:hypothetical protein C7I85_29540 [Mesorhizobium soli]
MMGMVAGTQFAVSLISRVSSGSYSDARGGKRTVVGGADQGSIIGRQRGLAARFATMKQPASLGDETGYMGEDGYR